jgi:hypothetical protein
MGLPARTVSTNGMMRPTIGSPLKSEFMNIEPKATVRSFKCGRTNPTIRL